MKQSGVDNQTNIYSFEIWFNYKFLKLVEGIAQYDKYQHNFSCGISLFGINSRACVMGVLLTNNSKEA
tara:strand:+ start:63796 stop:63999 length:204 start_codon:yes stop_codon:yes gene_type:complete